MRIRNADPGDAGVMAEFLLAMLHEMAAFGGHSIAEGDTASAWFERRITTAFDDPDHLLLLAESDDPEPLPLGAIEASIAQPHPVLEAKRVLHIHAVYVKPAHRRQGIGQQLMEAALQWGRHRDCVEAGLNALVGNPAHHLYESLGFTPFEIDMRRSL
jgi:GNAT superfamily N-acetyltransferase